MNKIDLLGASKEKITKQLTELGEKPFRGGQVHKWIMKGATSFDEMTDLSEGLREKLKEHFTLGHLKIIEKVVAEGTDTTKFLFELKDGAFVEAVRMGYEHGYSACVSTQVGCAMGCTFCASGKHGFQRNLTAGEMLSQVLAMSIDSKKVTHIVLMGTGEPLTNFDAVMRFMKMANDKEGLNISMRRITLSTAGLVPKIIELANQNLPITLSVSLHASNDKMRDYLMPVNKTYPIDELMDSIQYFTKTTGRRVTIEYILIKGMTDSKTNAEELIALLKGTLTHVNLIPYNPVEEAPFKRPNQKEVTQFKNILQKAGIEVTIRREMGTNIDAACGQLRNRYVKL